MKKSTHLVSQHLEDISRRAWDEYPDLILARVGNRSGVYALHRKGKLYYVGLARDLKQRLKAHMKNRHSEQWDRFSVYLTIGEQHLKEMESLILRISKPSGNAVTGKFPRSQDLKHAFARDVRQKDDGERRDLLGREPKPAVKAVVRSAATGRIPVLAAMNLGGKELRGVIRGETHKARVRQDGSIRYRGVVYNSPSRAGVAATGRSCNGHHFWKVERAPGDWVRLGRLRKGG